MPGFAQIKLIVQFLGKNIAKDTTALRAEPLSLKLTTLVSLHHHPVFKNFQKWASNAMKPHFWKFATFDPGALKIHLMYHRAKYVHYVTPKTKVFI